MSGQAEEHSSSPEPADPAERPPAPRLLLKRNTIVELRGAPSCVSPSILMQKDSLNSERSAVSFSWHSMSTARSQFSDDTEASVCSDGTSSPTVCNAPRETVRFGRRVLHLHSNASHWCGTGQRPRCMQRSRMIHQAALSHPAMLERHHHQLAGTRCGQRSRQLRSMHATQQQQPCCQSPLPGSPSGQACRPFPCLHARRRAHKQQMLSTWAHHWVQRGRSRAKRPPP